MSYFCAARIKPITMRRYIFSLVFLLAAFPAFCQQNPVTWTFTVAAETDGRVTLQATADIQDGWYVYSQHLDGDGPVPTELTITAQDGLTLLDEPVERGNRIDGYDEIFGMDIVKYKKEMTITQTLRLAKDVRNVQGEVLFMCCNDEQCLPPRQVPFSIEFK